MSVLQKNTQILSSNGESILKAFDQEASHDEATHSDVERLFLKKIIQNPNVQELKPDCLPTLKTAFGNAHWDIAPSDPYYLSPGYYGLTGRRGLWMYKGETSGFIFALHPNQSDHILIFSPFGHNTRETLNNFLSSIYNLPLTIDLARINDTNRKYTELKQDGIFHFAKIEEEILDWREPVVTVSNQYLINLEGARCAKLRQIRNKYQNISDKVSISGLNLSSGKDYASIMKLAAQWEINSQENDAYSIPEDYFTTLASLGHDKHVDINGILIKIADQPVAFSFWERPITSGGVANLFASQSLRGELIDKTGDKISLTNVNAFLILESARRALEQDGATHMCLGGSETTSMLKFKQKFLPVDQFSPKLETYTLER